MKKKLLDSLEPQEGIIEIRQLQLKINDRRSVMRIAKDSRKCIAKFTTGYKVMLIIKM